ncbi:Myb-binding protein 1A, partial [Kappamyces sp. JEL0680]
PSAVLRALSTDVFKTFASKSTPKVLDLFVEGAEELFEDEEVEAEEIDDEDESSEEESDDDDENTEPVDEELRSKIQAALAVDVEEDLDDLDDDAMEAFDSKLAEIFSQRKAMKSVKKETKESVLHFKLRVVDLLDTFLKATVRTPLFVSAIQPIAELYIASINSEDEKLLHNKIGALITNRICSAKELPQLSSVDEVIGALEKVHQWCSKMGQNDVLAKLSLFLVKVAIHTTNDQPSPKKKKTEKQLTNVQKVAAVYESSFGKWMTVKSSKLKPALFTDLASRNPLVALELVPAMIEATVLANKPKSFQQVKTFEIIATTFKSIPKTRESEIGNLASLVLAFSSNIAETLKAAPALDDKGPFALPRDRIKEILKSLGVVLRRFHGVFGKDAYASDLTETLQALVEHEKYKVQALQSIVKQTTQML